MKFLKIFGLFIALHLIGWGGAHYYQSQHPKEILIVADTSYAMRDKFPAMLEWINDYDKQARYKHIVVGTDKALLGDLASLPSRNVIFRTSFGSLTAENLARYDQNPADQKILLSDGSQQPAGWKLVKF